MPAITFVPRGRLPAGDGRLDLRDRFRPKRRWSNGRRYSQPDRHRDFPLLIGRTILFLVASGIVSDQAPQGLIGCLAAYGLGHLLYTLWSYCSRKRASHCVCVRRNDSWLKVHFTGFLGLVGKEPDVEIGLLVDTGASINIHGTQWFERFVDRVLKPFRLWSSEFRVTGAKVTGVEGKSISMDVGKTVPGNVQGVNKKTEKKENVSISFTSQQVRGNAPALLGLSLIHI